MKSQMEGREHAFTLSIDWEEFGQLLGRDHTGVVMPAVPKTIDRQTDIMLSLLNETNQKATFFILGMLAQYRPDLVKKIAAEGHEIGMHGQHHIRMNTLSYKDAYNDLHDSYKLVTDIIGAPVYGYRAPYFSGTALPGYYRPGYRAIVFLRSEHIQQRLRYRYFPSAPLYCTAQRFAGSVFCPCPVYRGTVWENRSGSSARNGFRCRRPLSQRSGVCSCP